MRQVKVFLAAFLLLAVNAVAQNTYPPLVQTVTYAGLGTSANNGTIRYCRDCAASDPCAGSGVGAFALRVNGAWQCSSGGGGALPLTGSTGFVVETAAGVVAARTLTNTDGCITISNGDGVSANPTINIDTTCVMTFTSGTGTASATGDLGTLYIETDTGIPTLYTNTDTIADLVTEQQDSIATADWFIDEDSFATNSATRVPSQQSVKAYVDANGGGSVDHSTTLEIYEDFIGGSLATTVQIGVTGMSATLLNSGALTMNPGIVANNPGVLILNPQTSDNGGAVASWSATGSILVNTTWTTKVWSLEAVVTPITAVTNTAVWFGLSSTVSGLLTSANGIWIRRDTDLSDTTFIFAVCDSATAGCQSAADDTNQNSAASTVTPVAATPVRFLITHDLTGPGSTSKISMSVGVSAAMETAKTFCSSGCDDTLDNLTAAALIPFIGYVQRAPSSGNTLNVDYMKLTIEGLARY